MIIKIVYIKPEHIEDFTLYCNYSGIEIHSNKKSKWITNKHHILEISCTVDKIPPLTSLLKMIK